MAKRGRRSAAEEEMATEADSAAVFPILPPPPSLNKEERELWFAVIAAKPSDWFRADSAPVLEAYVKAVSHYRALSKRMDAPPTDVDSHARLAKVVQGQASLVATLATKMRLTQQARYTPITAARRDRDTPSTQPWND